MKIYTVQTHLHGSGGHGIGSHAAYDAVAAREGIEDVVWWAEHDFRLANTAKVEGFSFDRIEDTLQTPNRDLSSNEPLSDIAMRWKKVAGDDRAMAAISRDVVCQGTGSLKLTAPAGGECRYAFEADNYRATFPVFTEPVIELAIYPDMKEGTDCAIMVEIMLSQQPPDFSRQRLVYSLRVHAPDTVKRCENTTVVYKNLQPAKWNMLSFDIAADILRSGMTGGLDHCLHELHIGLVNHEDTPVCAYFDALRFEPRIRGTAGLDAERALVAGMKTKLTHHVGMEFSYYGQHINCFGSSVPIPDYEKLLPKRLSSNEIVDYIHAHGGLACINHLPVKNMEATVKRMVAHRLFGVDLLEINRKGGGIPRKLHFWDRLSAAGLIVTGLTGSDCHYVSETRAAGTRDPYEWVNRVWARSTSEGDLMESLRRGRLFLADPLHFSGRIDFRGAAGALMGDVLIAGSDETPPFEVEITGAEKGDILLWLLNGFVFQASHVTGSRYREHATCPFFASDDLQAVRLHLLRPGLSDSAQKGLIAATNPIYVTATDVVTNHRKIMWLK